MQCFNPGAVAPAVSLLASDLRARGIDTHDLDELVAGIELAHCAAADDTEAAAQAAEHAERINDGGLERQIGYLFMVHEGRADDVRLALSNFLALPALPN